MLTVTQGVRTIPGGPTVLQDINLQVEPGEFIVIRGASGSGKSQLLRCLALLEKWTSGEMQWNGHPLTQGDVAYLEQNPQLHWMRSARDNVIQGDIKRVSWWRRITGRVTASQHMNALDMIERFGLLDKSSLPVGKLSGGEKQRIAIARTLVHGAKVLLIDEPVSGLDVHTAEGVLKDLQKLCREKGIIIVAVLSGGSFAEQFASRMITLNHGTIVEDKANARSTLAASSQRSNLMPLDTNLHRVLLVDDQIVLRDLLQQHLEAELPIECVVASNAKQVQQACESSSFSCIVLDLHLPDQSGVVLVENVRRWAPQSPIILITGMFDAQVTSKTKELSIVAVLEKPFDIHQLTIQVGRCITPTS